MADWIRVCTTYELLPGEYRNVYDGDTPIAVFNIDGELYAIADVCTHDGGSLDQGELDGKEIECPRHGARFDVTTGKVLCLPAVRPLKTYPARSTDGTIEIDVPAVEGVR